MDLETLRKKIYGNEAVIKEKRREKPFTIGIHQLKADDIPEILSQKLAHARMMGLNYVKILFDTHPIKIKKTIEEFLQNCSFVSHFEQDSVKEGMIWVDLNLIH